MGYVTSFARMMVASVWQAEKTENTEMDVELAEAFAEILTNYIEALQWCGASMDFQVDGKAREGWEKIVLPLIQEIKPKMNTFEKCKAIRKIILNRAAQVMEYKSWSDDFAVKQIRNIPQDIKKMKGGGELFNISPSEMTIEQLDALHFGLWEQDNPMRLIPLWLLPFLSEDIIETVCINREKHTGKDCIDNDNRGGYLSHGIIPNKVKGE